MSRRTLVVLIALALAGLAAFSIWRFTETVQTEARADLAEVRVYRATQLIEPGTPGAAALNMIEESTALQETVVFEDSTILCLGPSDTNGTDVDFTVCDANPSDLMAALDEAVAAGPIARNQLITSEMFASTIALDLESLSDSIPAGKVAMALLPGDVASVGGYIRPGDHVNIIASFTLNTEAVNDLLANPATRDLILEGTTLSGLLTTSVGQPPTTQLDADGNPIVTETTEPQDALGLYANLLPSEVEFTQTILQDIVVLAVGVESIADPIIGATPPSEEAAVIVELTTEQAEVFEFARQRAELAMSLLPADEPYANYAAPGVTVDDIFDYLERIREQLGAIGGN